MADTNTAVKDKDAATQNGDSSEHTFVYVPGQQRTVTPSDDALAGDSRVTSNAPLIDTNLAAGNGLQPSPQAQAGGRMQALQSQGAKAGVLNAPPDTTPITVSPLPSTPPAAPSATPTPATPDQTATPTQTPTPSATPTATPDGTPTGQDRSQQQGGSPTPMGAQMAQPPPPKEEPYVLPPADQTQQAQHPEVPPLTDDAANALDDNALKERLTNYDDVPLAKATDMLFARAQKLQNTTDVRNGVATLMGDIGDLIGKVPIPTDPASAALAPIKAVGDWANGIKNQLQGFGQNAEVWFQAFGAQNVVDYQKDLDRLHSLPIEQGGISDSDYKQKTAQLKQVADLKGKLAMMGAGGGLGDQEEFQKERQALQEQIAAGFYQVDPELAKFQGTKALQEGMTGVELANQQLRSVVGVGADKFLDTSKYITGHPFWANAPTRDSMEGYIAMQRWFRASQNAHQAGNVDYPTQAIAKWVSDYQKAHNLIPNYAEGTLTKTALERGYRADPNNIQAVSDFTKAVELEMVGHGLPLNEAMDAAATSMLKTGAWTYRRTAEPFLTKIMAHKVGGPLVTQAVRLATHYLTHGHIDAGSVLKDFMWDGSEYLMGPILRKWGPIGGQIFEDAANRSYNGKGYIYQLGARMTRAAVDARMQSLPYALAYSNGSPQDFFDDWDNFSRLHSVISTPGVLKDTIKGGTGNKLWVDPADGKPITAIDPKTGKPLLDAKGKPVGVRPPVEYRYNPEWDAANRTNLSGLDPVTRAEAIETQYATRDHTQIYYLTPSELADAQAKFGATWQKTPFGFFVPGEMAGTFGGKALAFVDANHIPQAMGHEAIGHGVAWAYGPEAIERVGNESIKFNDPNKFIKDNYGQDVTYDSLPEKPDPNNPNQLSKQMIRLEMGVEDIANYWHSGSAAQFYKDKPSLLRRLKMEAGKWMQDKLGFNAQTWEATSPMGVKSNFTTSAYIDGLIRRYVRGEVPRMIRSPEEPEAAPPSTQPPTIEERAYQISQAREAKGLPGDAMSDWLQAEHELTGGKGTTPKPGPTTTGSTEAHPTGADTEAAHTNIETEAEKGTPVGEAQARAQGKEPMTWEQLRDFLTKGPSAMPGRVSKEFKPPYQRSAIARAAVAAGLGKNEPPAAPGAAKGERQYETPTPTPQSDTGLTEGYVLPEEPKTATPQMPPVPTPESDAGLTKEEPQTTAAQPKAEEDYVLPEEEPKAATTPAKPEQPQQPKAATEQPSQVSDDFIKQLPKDEGLGRAEIVLQLENQTGEKDIKLNDPRVDAIWNKAQGGATGAVDQETKLPVKGSTREPVQPLEQPKDATNTSRTLRATWFGRNPDGSVDTTDERTMSYYDAHHGAWGADLLDRNLKGVAVSPGWLRANGIDPSKTPASQGYRVRVTAPNGKSEVVDIVDLGPRNTVDMTYGLGKALGLNDNSQLKVELLDHQGNTVALKDEAQGGGGGGGGGGGKGGIGPLGGGGGMQQAYTPGPQPEPAPTPRVGAEVPPMNIEPPVHTGGDVEGGSQVGTPAPAAPISSRGFEPTPQSPAMQAAEYEAYSGTGMVPAAPGQSIFMPSFMPRRGKGGAEEEPEESTLGEPMPKGIDKLLPKLGLGLTGLKQAQQEHAKLLSPDDTRVRQQGSGSSARFKGEHFVPGDPVHAAALADVPDQEKTVLAAGQTAIQNRKPMHMTYLSAPPARETPISRQSREVDYDESSPEARLMGSTKGRLAGHSIIPLSVGVSTPRKKGEPNRGYIEGISTSAAAHNHALINEALAMAGEASPYPEVRSPKFRNDFRGYIQNLMAGHKGTGYGYQEGTPEYPVKPDKKYVPYLMSRKEADFMNAIINNQRARSTPGVRELAQKGGTLLSEEGEVNPMRQAIDRAEIEDPSLKYAAKDRWSKNILEPTIRTFKAGLIKSLHEKPEHLPADLRQNVTAYRKLTETLSKEMGQKRGWPDIPTAANFMPRRPAAEPLSPEEHAELRGNIRKQFLSGKLRTADYLERLHDVPEPGEALEERPGISYMPMAGPKAQKFAEAEKAGRTFETPLPGGGKRFEIDDRDVQFKPAGPNAQSVKTTTTLGTTERPPKNALEARYNSDPRGAGKMPLSDAIRHPELFENYPFLRRTQISMDPTIEHNGHYEPPWVDDQLNMRGDHIVLRDPENKKTLAHEIQHAVQHYENFAGKGTNADDIAYKMSKDIGIHDELLKTWNAAYPEREDMSNKQFLQNEKERKRWASNRIKEMAFAMYRSEPGEIEARVAGERALHPSDEEREQYIKERELPYYERITPKQSLIYEMQEAEREARAAGTMNPSYGPYGYKGTGTPPRSEGPEKPERVKQAAVQYKGKTYEGSWHGEANLKAALDNGETEDDIPDIVNSTSYRNGFTTTHGRFVHPDEAWKLQGLPGEGYYRSEFQQKPEGPGISYMPAKLKPDQSALEEKVANTIAGSYKGKDTHPLEVDRDASGAIKTDPAGNPVYKKRDYNIVNSPLLKKKGLDQLGDADTHPDEIDPTQHMHLNQVERRRLSAMRKASAVATMGDKIVDSFNAIKDKPEIMSGKGWYSRMRAKLAAALGEHHELFAQLLGATSAKTPVRNNFIQSLDALEQFKSGAFDNHIAKYQEAYQKLQEGGKDALVAHMKAQGIPLYKVDKQGNRTDVDDHDTDASAMANWIAHHDIMPKQKNGQKYNANSLAVLRALSGTWLAETKAPKTPNFAGNLTGRSLEATIDVWAARHIQRLGYEGQNKGKPWRALSQAEPGVTALDFAFSQDAMRHAADKLGMNPDDLQAILWFAEKHHYEDKGWTRGAGAKKSSFDDVADLAFPKTGEPMTSDDLREHYNKIALAKEGLERYENHPKEKMRAKLDPYMKARGIEHHHIEAARAERAEPEEEEEAA